ncbi:MAG: heme-binding domain-containing protein [Flavobacteriales bacterium]|nr:heme-binding domain-containing protein [Flavobacteriales bacterium]
MLKVTGAPTDIRADALYRRVLKDCHSYRTEYPMWAYITPITSWIQITSTKAAKKVNHSRWDSLRRERGGG